MGFTLGNDARREVLNILAGFPRFVGLWNNNHVPQPGDTLAAYSVISGPVPLWSPLPNLHPAIILPNGEAIAGRAFINITNNGIFPLVFNGYVVTDGTQTLFLGAELLPGAPLAIPPGHRFVFSFPVYCDQFTPA